MKQYLHTYTVGQKDYYVIRFKNKYIAGGRNKEKILQIYKECEEADWNMEQVLKIKEKHRKHKSKQETKYIYTNQYGMYIIAKNHTYYTSSKNKKEIIKLRDLLQENNWDPSCLPKQHRKTERKRGKRELPKYIYKTKYGSYQIYKDTEYYGTFKKLEDAIEERELLIKYDWDYGYIDLY